MTLERLARVKGRLVSPGITGFPRGRVEASMEPGNEIGWTSTGEDIDLSGRFRLDLPPGACRLTATVEGFGTTEVRLQLAPGEEREVQVPIGRGATVRWNLFDAASGEPIPEGQASLETEDGLPPPIRPSILNLDNSFHIDNVPEGRYVLAIMSSRHAISRVKVEVRGSHPWERDVRLSPRGGVRGRVTREGRPAAGVTVMIQGDAFSRGTASAADGYYEIPDVPEGDHPVAALGTAGDGRAVRVTRVVTVRPADRGLFVEQDIPLDAVVLAGQVRRGDRPVEDAVVDLEPLDGETPWPSGDERGGISVIESASGYTDASGRYSADLAGPGKYRVTVRVDGKEVVGEDLAVPRGRSEFAHDIDLPAE